MRLLQCLDWQIPGKKGIYCFNAFFMSMRAKFVAPGTSIHWSVSKSCRLRVFPPISTVDQQTSGYIIEFSKIYLINYIRITSCSCHATCVIWINRFSVEFDPASLSWADFRGKVKLVSRADFTVTCFAAVDDAAVFVRKYTTRMSDNGFRYSNSCVLLFVLVRVVLISEMLLNWYCVAGSWSNWPKGCARGRRACAHLQGLGESWTQLRTQCGVRYVLSVICCRMPTCVVLHATSATKKRSIAISNALWVSTFFCNIIFVSLFLQT